MGTVGSGASHLRQQRKLQGTAHGMLRAREQRSVAGTACAAVGGEGVHARRILAAACGRLGRHATGGGGGYH